jgi:glycosyltransferase involved in cell wall biosynthesis
VGDGPERARLARAHPRCRFVGAQVGPALASYYASGDLFLFPSLTETFGNVVTEAMASGIAVNAFDYAAAHEHIRHGSNGLLAPFGDQAAFMDEALSAAAAPKRLRAMGAAARRTAESLSWPQVISSVEERLLDVLRQKQSGKVVAVANRVGSAASRNGA